MDKGVYCLVFRNPACTIRIGALGERTFRGGWHVYAGSALGSGGLARLRRHLSLALLRDREPRWHVDHLLTNPAFSLMYSVYAVTTDRLECSIACRLGGSQVGQFGSSDCRCPSHLFFRPHDPLEEILSVYRSLGLIPLTKTS